MKKSEKEILINNLSKSFSLSKSFYIVDPSGLEANDINFIRRKCFESNISYVVAKNTFIFKSLSADQREVFASYYDQVFKGSSGVFFLNDESVNFPARLIKNFRKQKGVSKFLLKGAYIDGDIYVGESNLDFLSLLKSKKELVGNLVLALKSSVAKVVSSLQNFEARNMDRG